MSGVADATFQVSGDFDDPGAFRIELTAQARQVTISGRASGPVTLTARTAADGRIDIEMATEIAGRRQPITASLEWRRPGRPITIMADLADFDIALLLRLRAGLSATGERARHGEAAHRRADGGRAGRSDARRFARRAQPHRRRAASQRNARGRFDAARRRDRRFAAPHRVSEGHGARGRHQSRRLVSPDGRRADRLFDHGPDRLGAFRRPDDYFNLDGEVNVDARIGGSINDPNLSGVATLRDISVSTPDAPITLDGGSGRVVLSGNRLTVENFTARAGGGSTQISGGATLSAFRPTEWRFDITANDAEALWRGVQAAIDANLTLTGTPQGQTLSGRVTITTAEYTSSELSLVELGERGRLRFGSFGGVREAPRRRHPPISLDVTVEARESFLIRSDQVNAVASATLRLAGPLADPEISGRVTFDGGAVIFRGRRYDITSGWLELSGGYEDPRLQLQAEGNIRGYRVIIGISGLSTVSTSHSIRNRAYLAPKSSR